MKDVTGQVAACGARTMSGHFGMRVSDLYLMEMFYTQVAGFTRLNRYTSRNTPGLRTVFLRRDDVVLELMHYSHPAASELAPGAFHLALECDDVDAFRGEVIARRDEFMKVTGLNQDAPVAPVRQTGDGFAEFVIYDPEGNPVEFFNRIRPFATRPVRAVIFDFDGTLVDSEPNYYLSDRAMMLSFGIDLTEELKRRYIGVGALQMMQDFKQRFDLGPSVGELLRIKDEYYLRQAVGNTVAYPEMERLVRALHDAGIRMAVASGSTPLALETLLTETGLRPFFDAVVSASEVPRSKPAPDIFLEAARRIGALPDEAAVFEDSALGVQAGVRAGMRTCAIPGFPGDELKPDFQMADVLVAGGMAEFSARDALTWLGLV